MFHSIYYLLKFEILFLFCFANFSRELGAPAWEAQRGRDGERVGCMSCACESPICQRKRDRDREGNVHTARFFLLSYLYICIYFNCSVAHQDDKIDTVCESCLPALMYIVNILDAAHYKASKCHFSFLLCWMGGKLA